MARDLIGQDEAVDKILPYLDIYAAGLSPANRPAGAFLLLGPTGTGKTHTVEMLAKALHGSEKNVLRVDCGEFQMEHEVAKLIGAPPGYLGHRETQPWLTQQKLKDVASEYCELSVVLFDEIEKAAISMTRILLGVLDRATLRLGDSSSVSFQRCLIFFISNVGSRDIMRDLRGGVGFANPSGRSIGAAAAGRKAEAALRKQFSPEFLNRIDATLTYSPLSRDNLRTILDGLILDFQGTLDERVGQIQPWGVDVSPEARELLLDLGTSAEYGARELRRTFEKYVIQPAAARLARGGGDDAGTLSYSVEDGKIVLRVGDEALVAACRGN